ncbi:MAG: pro-sigmaK processing inhibitor BofA family protein [Christensenellales bacterium]
MEGLAISWQAVLAYAGGLVLVFVFGKLLLAPLKWLLRLLYNGLIGGLVLLLINWIGSAWGFSIVVNPVSALVVGVFGIPGVILLLILKMILRI